MLKALVVKTMGGLKAMPEKLRWDGNVNVGTMIHLAVLLVTIVLAWGAFDKRTSLLELEIQNMGESQRVMAAQLQESNERTERIERYLISRDPKYLWDERALHIDH